jgi:hypothetical protein
MHGRDATGTYRGRNPDMPNDSSSNDPSRLCPHPRTEGCSKRLPKRGCLAVGAGSHSSADLRLCALCAESVRYCAVAGCLWGCGVLFARGARHSCETAPAHIITHSSAPTAPLPPNPAVRTALSVYSGVGLATLLDEVRRSLKRSC